MKKLAMLFLLLTFGQPINAGEKAINIIMIAGGLDNFTPFKDMRPDCPTDQRYKAVSQGPGGLLAYRSECGSS